MQADFKHIQEKNQNISHNTCNTSTWFLCKNKSRSFFKQLEHICNFRGLLF